MLLQALLLLLVTFYYDRGTFRISVAVLLLVGLLLWRGALSRHFTRPLSVAVLLLAAAGTYLRVLLTLPVVLFIRLLQRACLLPLKHALQKINLFYQRKQSSSLCARQLEAAKNGFSLWDFKRKEKRKCRKKTRRGAAAPPLSRS